MKKLLFLSVMMFGLTAFNGVAKEAIQFDAVIETVSDTPCADQAKKNEQALKAIGLGDNTIDAIVEIDFQKCLDDTYGN